MFKNSISGIGGLALLSYYFINAKMKRVFKKKFIAFALIMYLGIGLKAQLRLVDFSADHKKVVYTFLKDSVVHYFNREANEVRDLYPGSGSIQKINLTADNDQVVVLGNNNKLTVFNFNQNKFLYSFEKVTDFIAVDSVLILATLTGEIKTISLSKGKLAKIYKTHDAPVNAICLKKNKTELLVGGDDGWIKQINFENNTIVKKKLIGLGTLQCIAFNGAETKMYVSVGEYTYVLNKDLNILSFFKTEGEYKGIKNLDKDLFVVENFQEQGGSRFHLTNFEEKQIKENYVNNFEPIETYAKRGSEFLVSEPLEKDYMVIIYDCLRNKKYSFNGGIEEIKKEAKGKLDSFKISGNQVLLKVDVGKALVINESGAQFIDLRDRNTQLLIENLIKSKSTTSENEVELIPQLGYSSPLKDFLGSADQKYIITIGSSPVVKIWEQKTNFLVKEIKPGYFDILRIAVHPTLPLLAILDVDMTIHLVDLNTFAIVSSFKYQKKGYFDTEVLDLLANLSQSPEHTDCVFSFSKYGNLLDIVFSDEEFDAHISLQSILRNDTMSIRGQKELYKWVRKIPEPKVYWEKEDTIKKIIEIGGEEWSFWYSEKDSSKLVLYNNYKAYEKYCDTSRFFSDAALTKKYNPSAGKIGSAIIYYHPVFYGKASTYVIDASPSQNYIVLLKPDMTSVLYDRQKDRVIAGKITKEHFFTKDSRYLIDHEKIVDLQTGKANEFKNIIPEK
ncbi:MAG: hypothetical protein IAF38_06175, partial [Bacteroidia bacterium]|nr:hypothetical protein [Bacteroidia bacterium]